MINGFIEELKEWPSKYKWPDGSPKPNTYSMKVDGTRYGLKGKPPAGLKSGDYVQFEATQNGQYWNVDVNTIIPGKAPAVGSSPVAQNGAAASRLATGGWNDPARQDSITYQSARKDALELTKLLLSAGLVDFGKAKGAQKIEIVEIFVDNYTKRLFEDTKRLAPPDHNDPTRASYGEEVDAARKPRGRPAKATSAPDGVDEEADEADSNLPAWA